MPQVDYMTKVQNRVVPMVERVKARVKDRVFIGPGVTKLSPQEALTRLQQMTPEERLALVQSVGQDEFMSKVESLLGEANAKRR